MPGIGSVIAVGRASTPDTVVMGFEPRSPERSFPTPRSVLRRRQAILVFAERTFRSVKKSLAPPRNSGYVRVLQALMARRTGRVIAFYCTNAPTHFGATAKTGLHALCAPLGDLCVKTPKQPPPQTPAIRHRANPNEMQPRYQPGDERIDCYT